VSFQVLACLDEPMPTDGTCVNQHWVEQPSLLPPLSIADAQSIAFTFLGALVAVMGVKLIGRKTQ
jgi:hypothetical protein